MHHHCNMAIGHTKSPLRLLNIRRIAYIEIAWMLLASLPAAAQQQQPRPYELPAESVRQFAASLQLAVKANNPQLLASLVQFPLRVNTGPGKFYFVRREDFVSEYYKIFDVTVKAAILKQDMGSLEQSAGDIAIGDGMLTVAGVCHDRHCATVSPKVTTVDLRSP